MADMSPIKTPMPEADPVRRAGNFEEVALGYSEADAKAEAARCLDCKNAPCMKGCPVGVHIPDFIREIRNGSFGKAYEVIHSTNLLPAICGRATFAIVPSRTNIKVAVITAIVVSHGFILGIVFSDVVTVFSIFIFVCLIFRLF